MTLPLEAHFSPSEVEGVAPPSGEVPVPDATKDIIAFILDRYHAVHRQELPGLAELACKVESVHGSHPEVPSGLSSFIEEMADSLDQHMQKEEMVLFPMIERGGHPMIGRPISMMRFEHEEHLDQLATLAGLTGGFRLPEDTCGSWRALYAGLAKFSEDLSEHIRIENRILFPRFGA